MKRRIIGSASLAVVGLVLPLGATSASAHPVLPDTSPQEATSAAADPVEQSKVAVAGDISLHCTADDGTDCTAEATAQLVEGMNPAAILTTGDNQYDDGTQEDFEQYYDSTWGRFKDKTHPTPGNHEYYDPAGDAAGYKAYFGDIATPKGDTYYSWEQGNWHFVALDSELSMEDGSDQLTWLQEDLAANTKGCVAAYWHHPLFNSGSKGYDPTSLPVWKVLYENGADLVLNGHDHTYERFSPQDPDANSDEKGPVAITVGLGGADNYDFEGEEPNSEVRLTDLHGVLELSLTDTTFGGQLLDTDGEVRDTVPTTACHE